MKYFSEMRENGKALIKELESLNKNIGELSALNKNLTNLIAELKRTNAQMEKFFQTAEKLRE